MRILYSLLSIFALATAAPAFADSPAPNQVVQSLVDDLGKTMDKHRAELAKDREGLIKVIDQIVLPHFDIDYASILVLGQNARTATPEQRARFARAMYNSITHRYAEGLLKYTEGRVRVLPQQGELNDKRTLVRTQVVLDDGKLVPVDYAFRKTTQGDWKAYDVIIEGISYVTNYRNQVAEEIQKSSLDALTSRLENQGAKALESMDSEGIKK
ncbi:MAG: ABC transporter substrate-binding protein [Proteobacteria bacterium]|uniref:phospholipid-binding protein MlaC n=1 Tax=Rudaea sp. TaxID=2136325 RepID=UPI001D1E2801|nr:ABC transporter substrate-binding protein [Pseudomonadota bacterium]MBS0566306.1 ABC transporter substrate-binding protein [Pseudomonadota bacterium]